MLDELDDGSAVASLYDANNELLSLESSCSEHSYSAHVPTLDVPNPIGQRKHADPCELENEWRGQATHCACPAPETVPHRHR